MEVGSVSQTRNGQVRVEPASLLANGVWRCPYRDRFGEKLPNPRAKRLDKPINRRPDSGTVRFSRVLRGPLELGNMLERSGCGGWRIMKLGYGACVNTER